MASIERIKGGYRVRWREGGRGSKLVSDGKVYRRKDRAEAARARIEASVAAAKPMRARAALTLLETISRWEASRIGDGNDELHTRRAAARLRTLVEGQAWQHTSDVTPLAVDTWKQGGGSPRSGGFLAGLLRYARDFLDQPVDQRALVALRPRYSAKDQGALLADAAVRTWFEKAMAISPSAGALIHCLGTYGWRPITAARLKVSHVDLARGEHGYISIAVKGRKQLDHPITPITRRLLLPLLERRPPSAPLFTHPRTGQAWGLVNSLAIHQWVRDHLHVAIKPEKIGTKPAKVGSKPAKVETKPAKVYDLKRWAITRMLEKIKPHEAVLITGQTVGVLMKYARSNEATLARALATFDGTPWNTELSQAAPGVAIT